MQNRKEPRLFCFPNPRQMSRATEVSGGFLWTLEIGASKLFQRINEGPRSFLNVEMQRAHTFGSISVPNGMELISTELFLIRDGPLGSVLVYGLWTGTWRDCLFLQMGFIWCRTRIVFCFIAVQTILIHRGVQAICEKAGRTVHLTIRTNRHTRHATGNNSVLMHHRCSAVLWSEQSH